MRPHDTPREGRREPDAYAGAQREAGVGTIGTVIRRVVITGIGALTGPAVGADAYWSALLDPPLPATHRRLLSFDPREWMDRRQARRSDRFAQVAVAAGCLAHDDAGAPDVSPDETAVVMGTCVAGLLTTMTEADHLRTGGALAVSPLFGVSFMNNANAAGIAYRLGCRGPAFAVASGCASGTHAIGEAALLVATGRAEVAYAGGSEASLTSDDPRHDLVPAALMNLRVHTTAAVSRPFDRERDGFVYAEGAAVLRLETLDAALARDARIYAEICGYGNTIDAADLIAPEPSGDGLVRAMRQALAGADAAPDEVGFVNAHGTGTIANDLAEASALHAVFGAPGPPINSFKAVTGHSGAGAGALEAAGVALSIHHARIPPTAWVREVDSSLGLDVVVGEARSWEPRLSLSNSLSLGGQNGSLALRPMTNPSG